MNILIAKTILQGWINEFDIALYENDAEGNYNYLLNCATQDINEEIIDCLRLIDALDMKHILANKE